MARKRCAWCIRCLGHQFLLQGWPLPCLAAFVTNSALVKPSATSTKLFVTSPVYSLFFSSFFVRVVEVLCSECRALLRTLSATHRLQQQYILLSQNIAPIQDFIKILFSPKPPEPSFQGIDLVSTLYFLVKVTLIGTVVGLLSSFLAQQGPQQTAIACYDDFVPILLGGTQVKAFVVNSNAP